MGHCGEDTASTMSISRDAQDEYTVRSYTTAAAAYQVTLQTQGNVLDSTS